MSEQPKHVPTGYEIDRDDKGLTNREREVLDLFKSGMTFADIGGHLGVSRQRAFAVVKSLVKKGVVVRTDDGQYAVVVKR